MFPHLSLWGLCPGDHILHLNWLRTSDLRPSWEPFVAAQWSVRSHSLRPHGLQHPRPPHPSSSHRVCSNSYALSWWYHPTISCSVVPFSSRFQSFPASGTYPVSWLFTSGGQSIGASASASDLPMTIQSWFPLGWTGLISLQFKAF